jgi:hypothetical protein
MSKEPVQRYRVMVDGVERLMLLSPADAKNYPAAVAVDKAEPAPDEATATAAEDDGEPKAAAKNKARTTRHG